MARRGKYNPVNVTMTTPQRTMTCLACLKETGLGNYRVDAVSGRAVVVCESCQTPLRIGAQ